MSQELQIEELWPLDTLDVLIRVRWADMAWRGNKYKLVGIMALCSYALEARGRRCCLWATTFPT